MRPLYFRCGEEDIYVLLLQIYDWHAPTKYLLVPFAWCVCVYKTATNIVCDQQGFNVILYRTQLNDILS